jgi:hypothetical protein
MARVRSDRAPDDFLALTIFSPCISQTERPKNKDHYNESELYRAALNGLLQYSNSTRKGV